MTYPQHATTAPVASLRGYLDVAARIVAAAPRGTEGDDVTDAEAAAGLGPDFEALRWFELPRACLVDG